MKKNPVVSLAEFETLREHDRIGSELALEWKQRFLEEERGFVKYRKRVRKAIEDLENTVVGGERR